MLRFFSTPKHNTIKAAIKVKLKPKTINYEKINDVGRSVHLNWYNILSWI